MLSIIVAVHNQIGHNVLFLEGIRRYTTGPYEVIAVDNHSTDGSAEFFETHGCRVIRNAVNLCYPESMNLGIRQASGDYVCLINNDLYVGPNWNGLLIEAMDHFSLNAVSPLGLEMMPTPALTAWIQDRWATIGQGRLSSGKMASQLRKMIRKMYGNWERFSTEIHHFFNAKLFDGIIGSCVMVRLSTFEKIGLLDERIQAVDWDLYYALRKREIEVGDVHRCKIVGGCYVHHFMRATLKGKPEPFNCIHPRLSIDEKWEREEQARLWFKPDDFRSPLSGYFLNHVIYRRFGKALKKIEREIERALAWRWLLVSSDRILDMYRERFKAMG